MSILEELWYGNIEPAEYDVSPDKNYKDMLFISDWRVAMMRVPLQIISHTIPI